MLFNRYTPLQEKRTLLEIDWSNPLTEGLIHCIAFNESGGNARNLVDINKSGTFGSAVSWGNTRFGTSAVFPATGSSNSNAFISTGINDVLSNFSCVVGFRSTYATPSYYERLVDKDATNGFVIVRSTSVANTWACQGLGSSLFSITLTDASFNVVACTRLGASIQIAGFDNGAYVATGVACGTGDTDTSSLFIGNNSAKTLSFQGDIYFFYLYNRNISPYEHRLLYDNYLRIFKTYNFSLKPKFTVPEPPDYIFNPSVNIRDNKPYLYFTTGNRPLAFFDPPEINRGSTNINPEESDV